MTASAAEDPDPARRRSGWGGKGVSRLISTGSLADSRLELADDPTNVTLVLRAKQPRGRDQTDGEIHRLEGNRVSDDGTILPARGMDVPHSDPAEGSRNVVKPYFREANFSSFQDDPYERNRLDLQVDDRLALYQGH